MIDEGYIKFACDWQRGPPVPAAAISDLIEWRNRLFAAGLVGYSRQHGVGFGNLSSRVAGHGCFVISGTQTGHIVQTAAQHYAQVTDYDIDLHRVSCTGPVQASSEALTHAALYEVTAEIRGVAHVHSAALWKCWIDRLPTTSARVAYGTPEMARELQRLYRETDLPATGIAVMAGHEDGMIAFGRDISEAARRILELPESS